MDGRPHSERVCEQLNRVDGDARQSAFKIITSYLEDRTNENMAFAVGGVVAALASGGVPRSAIDVPAVHHMIDRLGKGNDHTWRALCETEGFDPDDEVCAQLIKLSPFAACGLTFCEEVDGQLVAVAAYVPPNLMVDLGRESRLGTPRRVVLVDPRGAMRAKLALDRARQTAVA